MTSKDKLLQDLKKRVQTIEPLEDEPDFFFNDETILRYLKAREWNLKEAEKQLLGTIAWRRKMLPLRADCTFCHKKPGLHSMRQIGFDVSGRPIIYSSFSQANCSKNTVEESIAHVMYLIENAKRTMSPGITTFVLVIDCSGITVQACNPKLGYEVTQILSNHYPERLGQVFCVNQSTVFQGIWNAIKVFLHPNTANKVKLLKKKMIKEKFQKIFSQETIDWLMVEMALNKTKNITDSQRTFWLPNKDHDPRGCADYVVKYIQNYSSQKNAMVDWKSQRHQPHPNVVDQLNGELSSDESFRLVRNSSSYILPSESSNNEVIEDDELEMDEWEDLDELNIPEELRIPCAAKTIK